MVFWLRAGRDDRQLAAIARDLVGELRAVIRGLRPTILDDLGLVAGLRALDDAVIVGRGERERLRHRVADEGLLGGALPLGGVFHGADADDAALALHEPRHGVLRAERARIRQADRGAGEIVYGQGSCAGTAYDVESGEVAAVATAPAMARVWDRRHGPSLGRAGRQRLQ